MNPIRITREVSTRVQATENVRACAAAFGIGIDESHAVTLYRDLDIAVGPGRIVYMTGESGAGKTSALRDTMAAVASDPSAKIIEMPKVDDLPDLPLVDQFGSMPLKESLELLTWCGISEAFVFLRRPRECSDGQRYRLLLGLMIHAARSVQNATPVVFIDEYVAFLDRNTARNVAYQTRRVASTHNICFVVATTHQDITEDLQADQTIVFAMNAAPVSAGAN